MSRTTLGWRDPPRRYGACAKVERAWGRRRRVTSLSSPAVSMTNSTEAEEHDGQTDHATWDPPMSLCVLCAQPTLGPGDLCPYHIAGQSDDWAAGNRVMCDFLHRGIVGTTRHDVADPSIELFDDSLEVALTP